MVPSLYRNNFNKISGHVSPQWHEDQRNFFWCSEGSPYQTKVRLGLKMGTKQSNLKCSWVFLHIRMHWGFLPISNVGLSIQMMRFQLSRVQDQSTFAKANFFNDGIDCCCWVVGLNSNVYAFGTCLMHFNDVRLFFHRQVPSLHHVRIFYGKIVELWRLGVLTLIVRKLGGCGKTHIFIGRYCAKYCIVLKNLRQDATMVWKKC